ncbi:MAG: hypothetical protein LBK46_09880 [Oscillospiraceae bacterium]|nr:hypothetical protein [Oscillospiraceae bacterium]
MFYREATEQFEDGELESSRVLFERAAGYGDSASYLEYIDAIQRAEAGKYADAIPKLRPLAEAGFCDTRSYLRKVKAEYAHKRGDIFRAIQYYSRLRNSYDALDQLVALRLEHHDYFISEFELPTGAASEREAFIVDQNVRIILEDNGDDAVEPPAYRQAVRVMGFRREHDGIYAIVIHADAPERGDFDADLDEPLYFIPADALFYT